MPPPYRPQIDSALLWKLTGIYAASTLAILRWVPMTEFGLSPAETVLGNPKVLLAYWKPIRTTLLLSGIAFVTIRLWFYELMVWRWQECEEAIGLVVQHALKTNDYDEQQVSRLVAWFLRDVFAAELAIALVTSAVVVILLKGETPRDVQPTLLRTICGCALVTAVWINIATKRIAGALVKTRTVIVVNDAVGDWEQARQN